MGEGIPGRDGRTCSFQVVGLRLPSGSAGGAGVEHVGQLHGASRQ